MKINSKEEILEILNMPQEQFYAQIVPEAKKAYEDKFGKVAHVSALMGYDNICKNQCLYCGMRAGNSNIKRFRKTPEEVLDSCYKAAENGYGRVFLVSGEDPKYGFENLLSIVQGLGNKGFQTTLACGEFEESQYKELNAAGASQYVVKFEISNAENFNRLNPSTNFEKRMKAIEAVKNSGMKLGSGNIVDWPGQTADEMADDILLMKKLEISWAPIIPYMPALGTPLAAESNFRRGELLKLYKEIAILRIMMPEIDITAQQPGQDLKKGLSDPQANAAAIDCGANMLFFDLMTDECSQNFRVIDDRNINGPEHVFKVADITGYSLDTFRISI